MCGFGIGHGGELGAGEVVAVHGHERGYGGGGGSACGLRLLLMAFVEFGGDDLG